MSGAISGARCAGEARSPDRESEPAPDPESDRIRCRLPTVRAKLSVLVALASVGLAADGVAQEAPAEYAIELGDRAAVAAGASGSLSLTIRPLRGRRISQDGPLRINVAVAPEPGLRFARRAFRRRHAADPRADAPRFELGFAAESAGEFRVDVDIRFWLCARRTCWPVRERRRVVVEVTAPPTPTPPPPPADAGPPDAAN